MSNNEIGPSFPLNHEGNILRSGTIFDASTIIPRKKSDEQRLKETRQELQKLTKCGII